MLCAVSDSVAYVLTTAEVAARLRVSRRTVEEWRRRGRGPAHFKAGRHVRYSVLDLEAWILENTHQNGAKRLRNGLDDLRGRLG